MAALFAIEEFLFSFLRNYFCLFYKPNRTTIINADVPAASIIFEVSSNTHTAVIVMYKKMFFLIMVNISCFAVNIHFKKLIFDSHQNNNKASHHAAAKEERKKNTGKIKDEINQHKTHVADFLTQLSDELDLMLRPLPIPTRTFEIYPRLYSCVLDIALHRSHLDLLEIIVSKPFTDTRLWGSIVFELARCGKSKVMAPLLELCKKYKHDVHEVIEYQNGQGLSPLIAAAAAGHRACVSVLLDYGAAPQVDSGRMRVCITALHAAVDHRHTRGDTKVAKIVTLLCKAGACGQAKGKGTWDHEPNTAIQHARVIGYDKAAQIMEGYALHQEKSSYFSLLPPDLIINAVDTAQRKSVT